jgi:hypothetical protein
MAPGRAGGDGELCKPTKTGPESMVHSVIAATHRKSMCPSTSRHVPWQPSVRLPSLAAASGKGKQHAKTTASHPASFIGKEADRNFSK